MSENTYSAKWFELFMLSIDPAQTVREIAFLAVQIPLSEFPSVLDVCCGSGRHANGLAELGYEVVGFDRDEAILKRAREEAPAVNSPRFVQMALDDLGDFDGGFDAALLLWQSFGSGDDAENLNQLKAIGGVLRPGGRLIIDLYDRGFFEDHQGERVGERMGVRFRETKVESANGRLRVELEYGDGSADDVFEWRIFHPAEFVAMAGEAGLICLGEFRGFDSSRGASVEEPRVQYVLERRGIQV